MTALPRLVRGLGAAASAALLAFALAGPAAAAPSAQVAQVSQDHMPEYYVSLGDSLAAGYQPDVRKNLDVSYTDQLYARLKQQDPDLVHIKLGCSGETTQTMIAGGICSYPGASSQLDAAVQFLRAHRGHVKYVTLDIGANDVDGCLAGGSIDLACTAKGVATVGVQLPQITTALRWAGGGHPRYAAMNYYDPFLAVWLTGPAGRQAAQLSTQLGVALNGTIAAGAAIGGFQLADVSSAFSTLDFTDQVPFPGFGTVPLNVARICQWTWECTPYHDIHATPTGHAVIADVFQAVFAGHRDQG